MQTLTKILKPKSTLRHLSTLCPPQQPPSPSAAYDELINEAGNSGNYRRLCNLLARRVDEGILSTSNTFRFITKSRSPIETLNHLIDCLATLPKGAPRQNAIDALLRRLCKLGFIDNAVNLLDEMHQRRLELTAFSFRPVFEVLLKNDEVEKAEELLWVIKGYGVRLDTSSFNYVLKGYCNVGDVASAVGLLEKMESDVWIKGDIWTYNAMVIGACKTGNVEGGLAVMRAAIDDGMRLTHYTYEHVIGTMLEGGYYEQAVKFVMACGGRFIELDNEIFDFLAIGLIGCKRVDEARKVVDEMSRRGLVLGPKLKEFHEKGLEK